MKIMKHYPRRPQAVQIARRGFTLLEMMVAIALALLMMTMFVQIFQMATGALSTQRAIAENDQRARRVHTKLTEDLAHRIFRDRFLADGSGKKAGGITPLLAVAAPAADPNRQMGYFYIAENDVDNDTDDVLQFTIGTTDALPPELFRDEPTPLPYYGRARYIIDPSPTAPLTAEQMVDQPVADDGNLNWNQTDGVFEIPLPSDEIGSAQIAEVCYFLRNGNLYRRVVLVRSPIEDDPTKTPANLTSSTTAGGNVGYGGNSVDPLNENYYSDFDYAAYYDPTANEMRLLEVSLNNSPPTGAWQNDVPVSLGIPKYRFGFFGDISDNTVSGNPVEFLSDGAAPPNMHFIGRFTHEETSNINFGYPGRVVDTADAAFNPYVDTIYDPATQSVTVASGAFSLIDGTRRAEDIILSNVHSFDIKVYDAALGRFENLGHSEQAGDYDNIDNDTSIYGNRFDTWHADSNFIGTNQTPFRPIDDVGYGADGQPGAINVDDDGINGIDDPGEAGWPGTDDVIPLRAIQIKIRYLDVSSDQMRDLTIVHSFADRDSE